MNIGIITLSASDNCGSLLQAFALQNVLTHRFSYDVEIIDYRSRQAEELYSVIPANPFKYIGSSYSPIDYNKRNYILEKNL